jgi:hypothetical protein
MEASRPFLDYAAVQKYLEDMVFKEYSEADRQARVAVLEEFCAFVGKTPDAAFRQLERADRPWQRDPQLLHRQRPPPAERATRLALVHLRSAI